MNSGAVLPTVRKALPSFIPVAADGGPVEPAVDERPAGSGHRRHVGHLRQRRGVAVEFGGGDPGGVGNDDGDVRRGVDGEVVAQLVTDLARRQRLRQHAVVGEAPLDAEERRAEQQQQRDDREADRNRPAHNEFRGAVPERLLDRLAHRLGPAEDAGGASRRTSSESSRSPSNTIAAGATTIAATAANATTAMPA